ncbi:helix-turn-helix domain-containing protein [Rhodobacter sp. KR11]|jgi:transcriptional regulator GlxA family with amidase domain|uniref:GlxA family transcriptional regulator n=1 Tax=Rhodobacter sp. KR11 TaxID=2974588 RepID=UPI00222368BA|nr:helix-turn-helix domain-containing protein [Rhodobacter sp. KR11]MCW1920697.1 helix-turn-helix domain-containing protein [Rhodobacter sp. KR11]
MLTLGFLLFPGFPMACLTQAIEPLRAANEITGTRAFAWVLLAETSDPVASSAGVVFMPDRRLDRAGDLDQLYLIAPPLARFTGRRSTPTIRRLDREGVTLGAFSGGVFPLARAGVMGGHRASVHWCYDSAFKAEFPGVTAEPAVITRDRRRFTAAGAGAVFDLMLRLIEERLGAQVMTEVACWFQHPVLRADHAAQKVPVQGAPATSDAMPRAIREAIRLFDAHVEDPLRIPDVAQAVEMSPRHFERLFKRETGQSPLRYYRHLRLSKARQRVLYSDQGLEDIAASVGYLRAGLMARDYAAAFGLSPRDERRRASRGLTGV